jgi:hypothetical protein
MGDAKHEGPPRQKELTVLRGGKAHQQNYEVGSRKYLKNGELPHLPNVNLKQVKEKLKDGILGLEESDKNNAEANSVTSNVFKGRGHWVDNTKDTNYMYEVDDIEKDDFAAKEVLKDSFKGSGSWADRV